MRIIVCPLISLESVIDTHAPSHVISLLSPGTMIETPSGIERSRHLAVEVNDIDAPMDGLVHPEDRHAQAVLDFVAAWADDPREDPPIAIHCYAGISRSMASAFLALCALNPAADEVAIAADLRSAAPFAKPNPLLVHSGDRLLDRGGRMIAALEAMGEAEFAPLGVPVFLPARMPG